jgi:hypothetical protein
MATIGETGEGGSRDSSAHNGRGVVARMKGLGILFEA